MANLKSERVEHALTELLIMILPDDDDEDEEVANQRFDAAYDFAVERLSA